MKVDDRIIFIDALRGFALLGIVLIHFVEHFDFFYPPEYHFLFSAETDQMVMDVLILFIGLGFGMWKHLEASWNLLFRIGFFFLQLFINKYWIEKFNYGPFEEVWRAFTYLDLNLPIKRKHV